MYTYTFNLAKVCGYYPGSDYRKTTRQPSIRTPPWSGSMSVHWYLLHPLRPSPHLYLRLVTGTRVHPSYPDRESQVAVGKG